MGISELIYTADSETPRQSSIHEVWLPNQSIHCFR